MKLSKKTRRRVVEFVRPLLAMFGIEAYLKLPYHDYVFDYFGHTRSGGLDIIRRQPEFKKLADQITQQGRTLLYYDRLYMIYQALNNVRNATRNQQVVNLAEVGTYKGGTTYFIGAVANMMKMPSPVIHCFDTFEGHSEQDINSVYDDSRHTHSSFSDTSLQEVKKYLSDFSNIEFHQGRFQDTAYQVKDLKFSFVHLDVDLYEPTCFGLDFFDERLLPGGIMIVDDYGAKTCPGIMKAVDAFVNSKDSYFAIHPFTEQCVLVKNRQ